MQMNFCGWSVHAAVHVMGDINTYYSSRYSAGIRRNPEIPQESDGIRRNPQEWRGIPEFLRIPPESIKTHYKKHNLKGHALV